MSGWVVPKVAKGMASSINGIPSLTATAADVMSEIVRAVAFLPLVPRWFARAP
jgi:hypothetical protein